MGDRAVDFDDRERWFADEVKRRDAIIDELREQNKALMAAALKQSQRVAVLEDKLQKLLKKHESKS